MYKFSFTYNAVNRNVTFITLNVKNVTLRQISKIFGLAGLVKY